MTSKITRKFVQCACCCAGALALPQLCSLDAHSIAGCNWLSHSLLHSLHVSVCVRAALPAGCGRTCICIPRKTLPQISILSSSCLQDRAVKAGAASAIQQQAEAQDAAAVATPLVLDHQPLPASAHSQQWQNSAPGTPAESDSAGGGQGGHGEQRRNGGGGGQEADGHSSAKAHGSAAAATSAPAGWSAETSAQAAQLRRQQGGAAAPDSAAAREPDQSSEGAAAGAEDSNRRSGNGGGGGGGGGGVADSQGTGSGSGSTRDGAGCGGQQNSVGGGATDALRAAVARDGRGSAAPLPPEAMQAEAEPAAERTGGQHGSSGSGGATDAARLTAARDTRGSASVATQTDAPVGDSAPRQQGDSHKRIVHFAGELQSGGAFPTASAPA